MTFIYTKQFVKDRKKLSKPIQNKIIERLELFLKNPTHPLLNNHWLNRPWQGHKSINVTGDIRLIYKDEGFACRLVRVGTHPQLYS